MRLAPFLAHEELERLHRTALRTLAETGVRVEHRGFRDRLQAVGGLADHAAEVVRFPAAAVERAIAAARKRPPAGEAAVGAHVGVYACRYLPPDSDRPVPFDEELLAFYAALARSLPRVERVELLGVPFDPSGIAPELHPLAEKLYAWKLGLEPYGTVQDARLVEPLLEMFRCHAAAAGRPLRDIGRANGFLISPLRLASAECQQALAFERAGIVMHLGHLPLQGSSAPVTLSGAAVLALAEQLFLFLVARMFEPGAPFGLGSAVSPVDMATGACLFGRPEQTRMNAVFGELGRFYGCGVYGHTGLTDAPRPSVEAGVQKASGALLTALACGHASVSAGLLGTDTLCSPVQLVLDDDLTAGLQALLAALDLSAEACAGEEIARVGPGGSFLESELTAARHRTELFAPRTWSGGLPPGAPPDLVRLDLDRARDLVAAFTRTYVPAPRIGPDEERELRGIIARMAAA